MATFANVSTKDNILTFSIKDVDIAIVNALRRIILSEIPTIALSFDPLSDNNKDIVINANKSGLHNEFLAHRISLIPLCFPSKYLDDDDYSPDDFIFKLKVKNTSSDIISVTSKDIKIYDKSNKLYPEDFHKQLFPRNPITKNHILITKLRPNIYNVDMGEEIDIEFKGTKNIAKVHSRWCPVSCCTLFNKVDDKEADEALKETLVKAAETKGKPLSNTEINNIKGRFNSLDRYRYFVKNKYGEASEFNFKVESECGVSPRYIFTKAFDVLIDKLNKLKVNTLEHNGVEVRNVNTNQNFHEVVITDEDFTLLNVLQCLIYNKEIRSDPATQLEYIGYYQPHPLDNKMILKLKFKTNVDIPVFLANNIDSIVNDIITLKEKWMKTV
jgi:DNA-directed RNA polymerase subunit L